MTNRSGTSSILQSPKWGLKGHYVLWTFKTKIESQNFDHGYIKDQQPYQNWDQDAKPQSGTSSVLQSPKWGLEGHGCSLHLQNQDREPKFGWWLYQRSVTISKSRSRCKPLVRNLQHPPKPQIRALQPENLYRAKVQNVSVSQTRDHIQIKVNMSSHVRNLKHHKAWHQDLKEMGFLFTFKLRQGAKTQNVLISKTTNVI